jgi:hypothetical protein
MIADAGEKAAEHFLEYFAASIRNPNTRAAYVQAAGGGVSVVNERGGFPA